MILLLLLGGAWADDEPGFGGPGMPIEQEQATPQKPESEPLSSAPDSEVPPLVPPSPATPMEKEAQALRLDPARFPLLAVRIDVERKELELSALEKAQAPPVRTEPVTREISYLRGILEDVERVALRRMIRCADRSGRHVQVRNFRMTPGGPVMLSTPELLKATRGVDPPGCERLILVDAALVGRVRRMHEIRRILDTTSFPYARVAERRALEEELEGLQQRFEREAIPVAVIEK